MAPLQHVTPAQLTLAALLLAAPRLDLGAAAIDPEATAAGLRARAGAGLDGWAISVRDAGTPGQVDAVLRGPDGRTHRRRLTLAGATEEDRSRELAASLALLIEDTETPPAQPPAAQPAKPPAAKPTPVRGWLGLGPRMELQRGLAEGGLDVLGGAWLLREHLQPLASLGWTATALGGVSLHTLRFGLGAAAGAPLRGGRLWLGGHVLVHGQASFVRDARRETVGSSSTEVGGTLQVRWPRWLLGVRTGVDLALPSLDVRGTSARFQRGPALWVLGVSFGVIFG